MATVRSNQLFVMSTALALVFGATAEWAGADDIAKGQALAERLCAGCHLNPGQGEKTGRAGIPGFSAVANRPGQSLEGIVDWLKSMPPMMPNHHLSKEEMFELAHFIMSLRQAE
jgi:mono/diheme cytochrome c family protein